MHINILNIWVKLMVYNINAELNYSLKLLKIEWFNFSL